MDKDYADTVRLLLSITPDVFANDIFAMKGGTAINLFVRDMPRLSVDIDVVYTPWQHTRDQALASVTAELHAIAGRSQPRILAAPSSWLRTNRARSRSRSTSFFVVPFWQPSDDL